jgi:hypothetical protein
VAGRDITEGDVGYGITYSLGVGSSLNTWTNTDVAYDVAVGGVPFISAINDARPYIRQTAPFKKDQFDNQTEPGEQSLTGWWIRSQMSFHSGSGIKFYDPATTDENGHYRFTDTKGVNPWTKGQVTLLKTCNQGHITTASIADNGNKQQQARSIIWNSINGVLLHDGYDVDKVYDTISYSVTNKALTSNVATLTTSATHKFGVGTVVVVAGVDATFNGEYTITAVGSTTFSYAKTASNVSSTAVSPVGTASSTITHFIDYNSGTDSPVYGICDDGTYAYWITNTSTKKTVYKKALTGTSSTSATTMFDEIGTVSNATLEYVKERIVMCADNKVYEFSSSASAMPSPVYTHPSSSFVYTSITASGPAIYIAGYNGIQSTISKFTLSSAGAMPTLTSATVAAEMPVGERVHKIFYYLGYMMIGTSKGIRAAVVSDQDGSINYGPLIVETTQPCYDFAARDKYVWCATGVGGEPGTIRVDLGNELETLRFAYANDIYYPGVTGHVTTTCAFAGSTTSLMFATAYADSTNGYVYAEDASILMESGYLTTGYIRYGTLEPKNFKRLLGRGDFTYGSLTLETIDKDGTPYDHITYDSGTESVEVTTSNPETAQEYVAYNFILTRDTTTTSQGPIFKGYQAKATIATPRQRIIKFPVYCFDTETDRYNTVTGYEGRAYDRILALEEIEANGDVITYQDLAVDESRQAVIEQILFTRMTPPDKRFTGFGGVIEITIRTV